MKFLTITISVSDGRIYDYKQLPSNSNIGDPTKTGRYCEACQGYPITHPPNHSFLHHPLQHWRASGAASSLSVDGSESTDAALARNDLEGLGAGWLRNFVDWFLACNWHLLPLRHSMKWLSMWVVILMTTVYV